VKHEHHDAGIGPPPPPVGHGNQFEQAGHLYGAGADQRDRRPVSVEAHDSRVTPTRMAFSTRGCQVRSSARFNNDYSAAGRASPMRALSTGYVLPPRAVVGRLTALASPDDG